MRTALSHCALLRPRSLNEALRLLADNPGTMPIAGCTDVYVGLQFGIVVQTAFLDVCNLPELKGISTDGGTLRIGAGASYTSIIQSPEVQKRIPILAEAALQIGGVQIQNRGTLGGNIANGSPAGDSLPVLAVANAVVHIASVHGERTVPFNYFYTGYRTNVLRPDELIVAVEIPRVHGRMWFRKVGTRAAQAISKIVMAAVRSERPRVALGSVAPTVVRLPATEASLASNGDIAEAQRVLASEIRPIDDLRSTADYRRRVSANLLGRFWTETT
jgi:xanthine dehydrogenase small subunit